MPDWCVTEVVFYGGTEEELEALYMDLRVALRYLKEGEPGWIGKLFVLRNVKWDNIDCRSFVNEIELLPDCVKIMNKDAWRPQYQGYEKICELYSLKYVCRGEERGGDVFINTDTDRLYFKDRYFFDIVYSNDTVIDPMMSAFLELNGQKYFDSFETISTILNKAGAAINSISDFENLIQTYSNRYADHSIKICFQEYENPYNQIKMDKPAGLSDKEVEKIWLDMTDVPFDENEDSEMVLAEKYYIWDEGTDRDTIWHWFDAHYSKGVYYLLYPLNRKYNKRGR